jgi:hypothetical protein
MGLLKSFDMDKTGALSSNNAVGFSFSKSGNITIFLAGGRVGGDHQLAGESSHSS